MLSKLSENLGAVLVGVYGFSSIGGLVISIWTTIKDESPWWYTYLLIGILITGLIIYSAHILLLKRNHKNEIIKLELKISETEQEGREATETIFIEIGRWLHKTAHEIRDHISFLDWLWQKEKPTLSHLQDNVEATGQHVVNYVEQILSGYLGYTISVSIKIIDKDEKGEDVAITLCRSQESASGRKKGDKHRVDSRNTAFFEISNGTSIYFGRSNLEEEYNAKHYQNSNPDWLHQYRCAIVVPIRKQNPEYQKTSQEKFSLIGFLCADAKEVGVFQDNMMDAYAEMMMAVADNLYIYLEKANQMQERINNDNKTI